jgi:hypothetical protein
MDEFIKWCNAGGCTGAEDAVCVREVEGHRGLVAVRPLGRDTAVVSIPPKLVLGPGLLDAHFPDVAAAIDQVWRRTLCTKQRAMDRLRLVALLLLESSRGPSSAWKPYFDVLPREYGLTESFSRKQVLGGTLLPVMEVLLRRRAAIAAEWLLLAKAAKRSDELKEVLVWERFVWASGTVASRTVSTGERSATFYSSLPAVPHPNKKSDQISKLFFHRWVDTAPCGVLVPLFDMANHSAEAVGRVTVQATKERGQVSVALITCVDVKKGEEVLLHYGPRGSLELFEDYGFAGTPNPHTAVGVFPFEVWAALSSTVPRDALASAPDALPDVWSLIGVGSEEWLEGSGSSSSPMGAAVAEYCASTKETAGPDLLALRLVSSAGERSRRDRSPLALERRSGLSWSLRCVLRSIALSTVQLTGHIDSASTRSIRETLMEDRPDEGLPEGASLVVLQERVLLTALAQGLSRLWSIGPIESSRASHAASASASAESSELGKAVEAVHELLGSLSHC